MSQIRSVFKIGWMDKAGKLSRSYSNSVHTLECPMHPKATTAHRNLKPLEIQSTESAKPFTEIPAPKGWPIFGTYIEFFRSGGGKNLHKHVRNRHEQFGPLYREMNSSMNVLFVGDLACIQDIYKHETKAPDIFVGTGNLHLLEVTKRQRGLLFMRGEEWRKNRRVVNNLILRQRDLSDLQDLVLEVFNDHLLNWAKISAQNDGNLPSVEKLIHHVELEGLGAFLMGKSFKKHHSSIIPEGPIFYESMSTVWKNNMKMLLIPPKWAHKLRLPIWTKFATAQNAVLDIGSRWTEQIVKESGNLTSNSGSDGLIHLLLKDMDPVIVDRIIADIVAGSEIEANTLIWALYALGRHPDAQEKIFQELNRVCGPGKKLDHRDLENTDFLRSCMKEILRLFPVPGFMTRFLQKDAIVGGYRIPTGTLAALNLFAAQRDSKYFPDPDKFWPERWSRVAKDSGEGVNNENDLWDTEVGRTSGYSGVLNGAKPYMAFGWGTRKGCVFRKVSLVQMNVFLGRLVQEFQFSCDEVETTNRTILVPDRALNFKVKKRV